MMKRIDRIFGWLLVVGAAGHTAGTIMWTQPMSGIFIWSLGSALAAGLLGALNIVRAGRPEDKTWPRSLWSERLVGCRLR